MESDLRWFLIGLASGIGVTVLLFFVATLIMNHVEARAQAPLAPQAPQAPQAQAQAPPRLDVDVL